MFLTVQEINTHLRIEIVHQITQGNDTLVIAAIDSAMVEMKSYLGRFDLEKIFSQTGGNRNALLLTFIKDIAVWHLINLCNAGVEIELRQTRYKAACRWLKDVQEGELTPDLPIKPVDDETENSGSVLYKSNLKRNQHF